MAGLWRFIVFFRSSASTFEASPTSRCSPDQYHSPRHGTRLPKTTCPGLNGCRFMSILIRYGWSLMRFTACSISLLTDMSL